MPLEQHMVSVVIATRNSSEVLPHALRSVRSQVLDKMVSSIEVIVVDGFSVDETQTIARQFGADVVENPHIDAIHAKYIGFLRAQGRYVVFLDHDEVLMSPRSISDRVLALAGSQQRLIALTSGYVAPKTGSSANSYASEFGDPVSLFLYRQSASAELRLDSIRQKYRICEESDSMAVFGKRKEHHLSLLEVVALGAMVDKEAILPLVLKTESPEQSLVDALSLVQLSCGSYQFVVMKNDAVLHKTADNWKVVRTKIRWRVNNYVLDPFTLKESGLAGRLSRESTITRFHGRVRLFGFVLYVALVIPVLCDALYLAMSRRRLGYMMHIPISTFTLLYALKALATKIIGGLKFAPHYDGTFRGD